MNAPVELSLPREHGAYLTLAAAALVATCLAPARLPVLLCAAAVSMAFLLRGPLDRSAAGLAPRRLDERAVIVLIAAVSALLAFGLASTATGTQAVAVATAGSAALLLPLSSFALRRRRMARRPWAEALALASLGGLAGVEVLAGGARPGTALVLAALMAAHAAASVPLVRGAVRGARPSAAAVLGPLGAAAVIAGVVAGPLAVLPLVPRLGHYLMQRPSSARPSLARLGLLECALLIGAVALATATLS